MAQLLVSYQEPNGRGHYLDFFVNFIDSVEVLWGQNINDVVREVLLSEYGASMIKTERGIMYVEFPDERDITMFLLRYS